MIGYVSVGTNDFKRATAFYDKLMAELGAKRVMDLRHFHRVEPGQGQARICVGPAIQQEAGVRSGTARWSRSRSTTPERVDALYKKAIELGATDEGPPGAAWRRLLRRLLPGPRRQQAELPLLDMSGKAFSISTIAGWADMDANAHMANCRVCQQVRGFAHELLQAEWLSGDRVCEAQARAGRAPGRARVFPRDRAPRADHGHARARRHGGGRLALPAGQRSAECRAENWPPGSEAKAAGSISRRAS